MRDADPTTTTKRPIKRGWSRNPHAIIKKPNDLTDVSCACGCGKKLTRIAVLHRDPYATTACAKSAFGVTFKEVWGDNPAGVRTRLSHTYPRCKCEACKSAANEKRRERKRAQFDRGNWEHGTVVGYSLGCKCEACMKANRDRKRDLRAQSA